MSTEEILKRLRDAERDLAVLQTRFDSLKASMHGLEGRLNGISGGIARILWLIGGAVLTSIVAFIVGGGLA